MKELIEKLKLVIKDLEKSKGSLLIFAIFLREDSLEKWDIIVAASWLDPSEMESYKIVSNALRDHLTSSDFLNVSRIVILPAKDPVTSFLINLEVVENGGYKQLSTDDLTDTFGFEIKRAYLLRSKKAK
jgi:hypothetical protein